MPTLAQILENFFLPAVITAAALILAWRLGRAGARDGRWMGAIALGAAFAVADCGISGRPHWPPGAGDAALWLIWFTIPVGLLGLCDALLTPPLWVAAAIFVVLARLAIGTVIAPLPDHPSQIVLALMAVAGGICWLVWENIARRVPGPFVPILMTMVLAASAAVLGLSNDIKPSQAAVAMTGTAAITVVASWRWRNLSVDRGMVLAWIVPLLGFFVLVHYYYYTEPPLACVFLLIFCPVLAGLAELPWARRLSSSKRWALRLGPVLLALAIAVGFAGRRYLQAQAADDSGAVSHPEDL